MLFEQKSSQLTGKYTSRKWFTIHASLFELFIGYDHRYFGVPFTDQTAVVYVCRAADHHLIVRNEQLRMYVYQFGDRAAVQYVVRA